jgi:hypothetical protein
MQPATTQPPEAPPPLGSWARLYLLVAFLAALVMLLLWLLTTRYHLAMAPA